MTYPNENKANPDEPETIGDAKDKANTRQGENEKKWQAIWHGEDGMHHKPCKG